MNPKQHRGHAMGLLRRSEAEARKQPYVPLALAAKTALDVFNAARLTRDQWTKHRAFCVWCLIAAGATFATVPFVIPETVEAISNLKSRGLQAKKAA